MPFNETAAEIATRAGQDLGIDPAFIYGQFSAEGTTNQLVAAYNYGNIIKQGKLVQYRSPEDFLKNYEQVLKQDFPQTVNAGNNFQQFVYGLEHGKYGQYFDPNLPAADYEKNIAAGALQYEQSTMFQSIRDKTGQAATDVVDKFTGLESWITSHALTFGSIIFGAILVLVAILINPETRKTTIELAKTAVKA